MSSLAGGFVQILFGPHLRSTDNRPAGARPECTGRSATLPMNRIIKITTGDRGS